MKKNIFIFDENKCVGCHACVLACINENGFQSPERWRNVWNSNPLHHPDLPLFYFSMACNHCHIDPPSLGESTTAPCMIKCPSLAFTQNKVTGAIEHDPDQCIGCKYCTWTCPYDAPKFNPQTGLIEKCTFCEGRIEEGLKPACANLCPTGALEFGKEELTPQESFESSPVAVKVGSSLKVIKLKPRKPPSIDREILDLPEEHPEPIEKNEKKISASKEWPLLIFSLLSAWMVSIFLLQDNFNNPEIVKWAVSIFGLAAAFLSPLHLGKKQRAWKAILNIEGSWLSREIFFFIFFLVLSIVNFFIYDLPDAVILINGLLLLISIDMLYLPATWKWKLKIHSGQVLFIVLNLWLLISGYELLFLLFTIFRSGLYAFHKGFKEKLIGNQLTIFLIRLIIPVVFISVWFYTSALLVVLMLIIITDILDRIEYYEDLRIPSPEQEIQLSKL